MQLKLTTNYTIRILLCLLMHRDSRCLSSSELANLLDISANYILKIMSVLSKQKYVIVEVGKYGGFRINPIKEPICLYDVLKIMEPTIKINDCLEAKPKLNYSFEEKYEIVKYWQSLQTKLEKMFSITLEEFIKTNRLKGEKLEERQWKKSE